MASQLQRAHPLQTRLQSLDQLPDGLQVTVDPFLTMTNLRFQPGPSATDAVTTVLDVPPPTQPNTWIRGNAGSIIWLGPGEWLVVSEVAAPETQEAELRAAVTPFGGAAVDVSGQRISLTLRGRHVRDVLAKGCALDLHHSVFRPGSCAQTTVGRAGVVLLASDDPGEFTVLVRQSFASYLADWLIDAAEEFRPA
jgi:sarcosine oxidase subunit gamma